jgi:hypothetical protein
MEDSIGRKTQDESQISRGRYFNEAYFREETIDSLVFQLVNIYKLQPRNILEVGIGNGFVSDFLKKAGMDVTTVDINPALAPDYVGGFDDLDILLEGKKFEVVLCAEVLEHLPFAEFEKHVKSLFDSSEKYVFITIPRAQKTILDIRVNFTLRAKIFQIENWMPWLFYSFPKKKISKLHHWEINHSSDTKLSNILEVFGRYGSVLENGLVRRNHYHHYFIIRK